MLNGWFKNKKNISACSQRRQLKEACQSLHFSKIPGKKSISNPRSLPGIYTLRKIMAPDGERVFVFPAKSRPAIDFNAKAYKC